MKMKFLTVCLVCVIAASTTAKEREVSKAYFTFPASLSPDQVVEVRKVIDTETDEVRIVSNIDQIRSFKDLEALMKREREADRKKYGAINGRLKKKFDSMGSWENVDIRVYLKMPVIRYLDKTKHSEKELERQSKDILKLRPVTSVSSLIGKYRLAQEVRESDRRSFRVRADKNTLQRIMFDESVAAIEEVVEETICRTTTPFSNLASSAANPPPLPATGHGVNAATFERGIWQSFFNCLGNLNSGNIAIDDTASLHSQETFLCLYNAAPGANLYHHVSLNFHSPGSQDYLVNNSINTASISYSRSGNSNTYEYCVMDDFAYRWPYPVFCNLTGRGQYDDEVYWQCYNAVSVGMVRHTDETTYEIPGLPGCSHRARNPDPVYGGGTTGDREMPHILAPGVKPVKGIPWWDDCLEEDHKPCGTSYAAPTANGIAASVISSDSRMTRWPEKVRVALLATAHNVDGGDWDKFTDGRDGAGVISGTDAIWFAQNHTMVWPNNSAVEHGMHASTWSANDYTYKYFYIRIPNPKPPGKHLRIVLTWDSNPDLNGAQNHLSDLDFSFYGHGFCIDEGSFDSNIEIIDVANSDLIAGDTNFIRIFASPLRIPEHATFFYWAVGWTWVKDHAD